MIANDDYTVRIFVGEATELDIHIGGKHYWLSYDPCDYDGSSYCLCVVSCESDAITCQADLVSIYEGEGYENWEIVYE